MNNNKNYCQITAEKNYDSIKYSEEIYKILKFSVAFCQLLFWFDFRGLITELLEIIQTMYIYSFVYPQINETPLNSLHLVLITW